MSKSRNDHEEEDIYSDLPDFQYDDTLKKLETSKKALEEQVATLQIQLEKLCEENKKLNKVNHNLSENISSLYKTANNELRRKDRLIQELRDENDRLIFRKKRLNSKPEYSAVSKDVASEGKNHNYSNFGVSVLANKCSYIEEVGNEISQELSVNNPHIPPASIPHNAEQTNKITLLPKNTSNCLKSSDCDLKYDKSSESFHTSNELKEINSESKFLIKLKKSSVNKCESPEIYPSRLEKQSPKPEYLEKHMAHRIKEMSSKYSSRSSSVKMANTVKYKYSKSRSSRSKTPFDKNDYRMCRVSRGRSPHRRDSNRQLDISFMHSVSRYSRSRGPPRRSKNYDSNNRYHYSHSNERKYNFKIHSNVLDKFDSKHEGSSKRIPCSSKEREASKNSIPVSSRHEDKTSKSFHSSKPNSTSENDYELHKSKVNTFPFHTNDVPAETKKPGAEPNTIKLNDLDHLPKAQKEIKSASCSLVENLVQKIEEATFIASNHAQNSTLDKTNSSIKYNECEDIVKSNAPSRENLEIKEIKCYKENSDENKSNFQSPMKVGEHNTNLVKTSPTFKDPAIFKGGSVSICMFNEQVDFTRKRKRAKLVVTNKSFCNLPVESEIVSKVPTENRSINGSNTLKQVLKESSVNYSQEIKKIKLSSKIESSYSTESNTFNSIQNENIKISHNNDTQMSQISSSNTVSVAKKPKILTVIEFSHDDSRKNNDLSNCGESKMVLTTNNILMHENVISKDGTVEKRKGSGKGETLSGDNVSSQSKSLFSNKENNHSTATSKDKETKILIVKDNNRKEVFDDSLEEGELIDENSLDESSAQVSNVDEIPSTKVEKIQERTNQRRLSGNSRRTNSTTRQTTRVKNAFGNNICERRSPSELFTGDKSLRKINTKGDSHSKIMRSDDEIILGNRTSEKRNDVKLKQANSKHENKNRQKRNHSHHFKISHIDKDKQTDEIVSDTKKIQNVDKEHTESIDIKIDFNKSRPREKLKERNQKILKQPSRTVLNNTGLSTTESKENACESKEKRKMKRNKFCEMNLEKLSTIVSDLECVRNKTVNHLQNLLTSEPLNNPVKVKTTQQETTEKQETTVSDDKYTSTVKIIDTVETNQSTMHNFCPDISHDIQSSDANSNKTKSDIHAVNNISDNCHTCGTSDTGLASIEVNDSLVKVYKHKNARMTRSKMNTPSTKGKSNSVNFEKLVKGVSDSESLQNINCLSNYPTALKKGIETLTMLNCLKNEMNENTRNTLNSHCTSDKPLSCNENNKQTDHEISSLYKGLKHNKIGIEKLATDTNHHVDIKYQSIESCDSVIDENCDVHFSSKIITPEDNILHSLEQEDTRKLSEVEIKSPLISSLNTVENNEKINNIKSQIMSNEELIQILAGSPPSAPKNSVSKNDKNICTNQNSIIMEQKINLKTPEPSQQSVKAKTIIMHRRSRVRMFQDSPIQTFTISSKLDHKIISNTSPSPTDRRNEFIKECDVKHQNKLEDPCAASQFTVSKNTAQVMCDREKIVNLDMDKSSFTKHSAKNSEVLFSDVFGTDNSDDSSDNSDGSVWIPKNKRCGARGHTKKKKKIIKVKLKTK